MRHDQDILARRCMEEVHIFTRTQFGCFVDGPLFDQPKFIAVGGSPDASEEAARRLVRELSDLDVRPKMQTEIDSVRASVRRCSA